jgi:hypothetical protein
LTRRESFIGEAVRLKPKPRRALVAASGLAIATVVVAGLSVPALRPIVLDLGASPQSASSNTAVEGGGNPSSAADPSAQNERPASTEYGTRQEPVTLAPDREAAREPPSSPIDPLGTSMPQRDPPISAAASAASPQPPAEPDAGAGSTAQVTLRPATPETGPAQGQTLAIAPEATPVEAEPAQPPRAGQPTRTMNLPDEPSRHVASDHGMSAPPPPTRGIATGTESRGYRARRQATDRGRRGSAKTDTANAAAERLLASGQIVAARQEFARAAAAGDPRGARGVARTFDERVIGKFEGSGVAPDREKSARWYGLAAELEARQEPPRARKPDEER